MEEDCDDNDPESTSVHLDSDCDGVFDYYTCNEGSHSKIHHRQ